MIFLDEAGAATPFQVIVRPPPDLSSVVSFSWLHRVDETRISGKASIRIVPDDSCHLMLQFRDDGIPNSPTLVGPRGTFIDAPLRGRSATVGVRLRPGVVTDLFGIPPGELRDDSIRLAELALPGGMWDPHDQSPEAALEGFGKLVSALSRDVSPDDRLVRLRRMTRFPGSELRVSKMASDIGLSERQLREIASRKLGLSPRSFVRIRRLYSALANRMFRSSSWARVAAESGYHDQSHMIKDFRDLLGEPPGDFERRKRLSYSASGS